ncbi:hypothetical protein Fmac_025878 [Flemingia macrophylla]|uniref:Uncharacterized protein n=1 Tax=Flemingia macrophylla TaxID=520843 RepID=A0ABD1LD94_9FABA
MVASQSLLGWARVLKKKLKTKGEEFVSVGLFELVVFGEDVEEDGEGSKGVGGGVAYVCELLI